MLIITIVVLCLVLIVALLLSVATTRKRDTVDPLDHGWTLDHAWNSKKTYTKQGGWVLYQTDGGWVLDKVPKDAPGVVKRMDCLDEIEIEFINGVTTLEHVEIRETAGSGLVYTPKRDSTPQTGC